MIELRDRIERIEVLSDADAKRSLDPVDDALARLASGDGLERADYTALVGALVEAVKELDERVRALEGGTDPEAPA